MSFVLALDQGTTSSRAIAVRPGGRCRRAAQRNSRRFSAARLGRARPAGDLGDRSRASLAEALASAGDRRGGRRRHRHHQPARDHRRLGPHDRQAGAPTRSSGRTAARAAICDELRARGQSRWFATQAPAWCSTPTSPAPSSAGCSTTSPGARDARERGELAFGTIDTWLIWKLTGGAAARHRRTNASRTMLFNIHTRRLGRRAARAVRRPARGAAGRCASSSEVYGDATRALGDARSRSPASPATSRRRCSARPASRRGMAKNTYGTGCFLLMNTGDRRRSHRANGLLTTVAWQLGGRTRLRARGQRLHRRRGRAVAARWPRPHPLSRRSRGAARRACPTTAASTWCRRSPGSARRTGTRTRAARSFGLTRGTTAAHIARATLEAIAFQSADVLRRDGGRRRPRARASCASTAARAPTIS